MTIRSRFVAVIVALSVVICSGSVSVAVGSDNGIEMKLDEVSANITTGEIESSIDVLEKMPVEGMNIVQLSRRHFLLGKADP
jgi:hypothetical protein